MEAVTRTAIIRRRRAAPTPMPSGLSTLFLAAERRDFWDHGEQKGRGQVNEHLRSGSGSWGGRCPSPGDCVRGGRPRRGLAPPERANVSYALL
jgi:hypothetical protein